MHGAALAALRSLRRRSSACTAHANATMGTAYVISAFMPLIAGWEKLTSLGHLTSLGVNDQVQRRHVVFRGRYPMNKELTELQNQREVPVQVDKRVEDKKDVVPMDS